MDGNSKLYFSNNGAGVILRLGSGYDVHYSVKEFRVYQHFFKVCDSLNVGSIALPNTYLYLLLDGTRLHRKTLHLLITFSQSSPIVTHSSPSVLLPSDKSNLHILDNGEDSNNSINFHQWMILCKIIAYLQLIDTKDFPVDRVNSVIFSRKVVQQSSSTLSPPNSTLVVFDDDFDSSPFTANNRLNNSDRFEADDQFVVLNSGTNFSTIADFSLGSMEYLMSRHESTQQYQVHIVGWDLHEDNGYDKNHVRYKLVSETYSSNSLVCRFETTRRFSDFVCFVDILQKTFKGIVLPPLPYKSWSLGNTDLFQRCRDLQLFLNDLVKHLYLQYSFELRVFLEASMKGFEAFRQFYPRYIFDLLTGTESSSMTLTPSLVSSVGEAASIATNTTVNLVNAIWTAMHRSLPIVAQQPCTSSSSTSNNGANLSGSNLQQLSASTQVNSSSAEYSTNLNSASRGKQQICFDAVNSNMDMYDYEPPSDHVPQSFHTYEKSAFQPSQVNFDPAIPTFNSDVVNNSKSVSGTDSRKDTSTGLRENILANPYSGRQVRKSVNNNKYDSTMRSNVSSAELSRPSKGDLPTWGSLVAGLVTSATASVSALQLTGLSSLSAAGSFSNAPSPVKPNLTIGRTDTHLEKLVMTTDKKLSFATSMGAALERLLEAESKRTYEISQISYFLKQLTLEDENISGVDAGNNIIINTHTLFLETVVQSHQKSIHKQQRYVLAPILYLSRYSNSLYQAVTSLNEAISNFDKRVGIQDKRRQQLDSIRMAKDRSQDAIVEFQQKLVLAESEVKQSKKDQLVIAATMKSDLAQLEGRIARFVIRSVLDMAVIRSKCTHECTLVWNELKPSSEPTVHMAHVHTNTSTSASSKSEDMLYGYEYYDILKQQSNQGEKMTGDVQLLGNGVRINDVSHGRSQSQIASSDTSLIDTEAVAAAKSGYTWPLPDLPQVSSVTSFRVESLPLPTSVTPLESNTLSTELRDSGAPAIASDSSPNVTISNTTKTSKLTTKRKTSKKPNSIQKPPNASASNTIQSGLASVTAINPQTPPNLLAAALDNDQYFVSMMSFSATDKKTSNNTSTKPAPSLKVDMTSSNSTPSTLSNNNTPAKFKMASLDDIADDDLDY